ncbi:MAG: anaerobic glycerol-3-phosphate dehydrogenase subunit C [Desulfobacterium sp.]|nr:anaerobic glycerol-3-phosphate dehydrogenase subunit C [Desulfobacterium sp.]
MNTEFEHCIRCTLCVENCPVFRVDKDYPGPKQAGPDAARFRADNEAPVDEWVRKCAQCKRCDVACPYGVNPSELIQEAQVRYSEQHGKGLAATLFSRNYYLGLLGSLFAPVSNAVTGNKGMKKLFRALGISTYMTFPRFHFHTLSRSWQKKGKGKRKVVFFHGCYLDNNSPDLGRSMTGLLADLGIRVKVPKQVCCGVPALANGDLKLAKRFAAKNASILAGYIDRGYDVVYACTSCGNALTQEYPGVLDPPEGKKIAENTYDIHEYILMLMEAGEIKPDFAPVKKRVAYHIPCHLRSMGIGYPAAKLLRMIPGLTLQIHDDNCCGLSGSYGFKTTFEDNATHLGRIAGEAILERNPDLLISDCGACRMQLKHFTALSTMDPTELLRLSLSNKPCPSLTH